MGALGDLWTWYDAQIEANGGGVLLFFLYTGMLLTERVAYLLRPAHRSRWDERDALTNIATSIAIQVAGIAGAAAVFLLAYGFVYEHLALFRLPNAWWAFLFAFVLNDFLYWLDHVVSHRNGFFWTWHQTHHSSREMNLTVSPRGHVLLPFFQPIYLLLPLFGVPLAMAFAVKLIGNLWGIFNHTRLVHRMGPLERWLCTPANHRVHHGTEPKYLDKNYGQTLLVWDRLFGTWQPEEEEPTYGLVSQAERQDPLSIQLDPIRGLWRPLRAAPGWRARLGYLWHPPGWSHTGQHERTAELVARERQGHQTSREVAASRAPYLSPAE